MLVDLFGAHCRDPRFRRRRCRRHPGALHHTARDQRDQRADQQGADGELRAGRCQVQHVGQQLLQVGVAQVEFDRERCEVLGTKVDTVDVGQTALAADRSEVRTEQIAVVLVCARTRDQVIGDDDLLLSDDEHAGSCGIGQGGTRSDRIAEIPPVDGDRPCDLVRIGRGAVALPRAQDRRLDAEAAGGGSFGNSRELPQPFQCSTRGRLVQHRGPPAHLIDTDAAEVRGRSRSGADCPVTTATRRRTVLGRNRWSFLVTRG